MRFARIFCFVLTLDALCVSAGDAANFVQNSDFEKRVESSNSPAGYELSGRVEYKYLGDKDRDSSSYGVAFNSGALVGAGDPSGAVSQVVKGIDSKAGGRWYRFSIRGFPQEQFLLENDGDLFLKVDFYGNGGKDYFDAVTKSIYDQILKQRADLNVNGVYRIGGAASWHTYEFDFKLPFVTVDQVKLTCGFRRAASRIVDGAAFWVDDFSLVRIPDPIDEAAAKKSSAPPRPVGTLIPIGGRWFFDARNGEKSPPIIFDSSNVAQLFYKAGRWETPFAGNASAWMRAGYKDIKGQILSEDKFVPDSVKITFTANHMVLHCKNIPNHFTATFPQKGTSANPNYIQEQDYTYFLLLNPAIDVKHLAVNTLNSNRALHGGSIGVAVNGVVFYNPFDVDNVDATNQMDRCCGHPSPDNRYHYHKYPICIKTPWNDDGAEHSPLIGWAFDGFPIYGPYESASVLARDIKGASALNEFNVHWDKERGWHYHVTPGKYPYIIGGFWGIEDTRNPDKLPAMHTGPGPDRPDRPENRLPPDQRPPPPFGLGPGQIPNGPQPPPPPPRDGENRPPPRE